MHKTPGALKEIDALYAELEKISGTYNVSIYAVTDGLYGIDSRRYPLSKETLDTLDVVA